MPQSAAGTRVDPPVSDPRPQLTIPAAMAAAVPPEEPPGIRVLSYGFFTGPANDDRLVLVMPNASSCMLVLPMTMAPASSNFCNDGAFLVGRACRSAGVPPDVGISAVLMLSLTTIGRPARAPVFSPASTRPAAASAPSLFRMMNALRSLSCSARSSAARTAVTAVIFLSRIEATISAAVGELESAIAELTYPREGSAAPAARAIDDVRISRREGLVVMDSSD